MRRQARLWRGVPVPGLTRTRLDTTWMDHAACATTQLPWIAEPQDVSEFEQAAMRAVCRTCPVLDACGDYSTARRVNAGYWAGLPRNRTSSSSGGPTDAESGRDAAVDDGRETGS